MTLISTIVLKLTVSKSAAISDGADADDALDIFADNIDSTELSKPTKVADTATSLESKTNGCFFVISKHSHWC